MERHVLGLSIRGVSVVLSSTSPKEGAANDIVTWIYLRAATNKRVTAGRC